MLKNNIYKGSKNLIYEDEQCVVLEEKLKPHGLLDLLVVPKKSISALCNAKTDDKKLLGHLILVANKLAIRRDFKGNSFQITVNEDPNTGKVKSLHITSNNFKRILWPITPNSRL